MSGAINDNIPADDGSVSTVALAPHAVRDDDDLATAGCVIRPGEMAAQKRGHAKRLEEAITRAEASADGGAIAIHNDGLDVVHESHGLEAARLLVPILKRPRPDADQVPLAGLES